MGVSFGYDITIYFIGVSLGYDITLYFMGVSFGFAETAKMDLIWHISRPRPGLEYRIFFILKFLQNLDFGNREAQLVDNILTGD